MLNMISISDNQQVFLYLAALLAYFHASASRLSNIDDLRFSKIQRKFGDDTHENFTETCLENSHFIVEWQISLDINSSDLRSPESGLVPATCFILSVLGNLNGLLLDEINGQPKLVCLDTDYLWKGIRLTKDGPDSPFRRGKNIFMLHLVTLAHREVANATVAFEASGVCSSAPIG